MPFIFCARCGSGCYSNVHSCPTCRTSLRPEQRRRVLLRERLSTGAARADEEVEAEVRDALYGWHSGCIELCRPVSSRLV